MEVELVKALSKPVEKLIEVFSKGAGTVYKPKSIRNEADAEAYKIEVLANAEAKKIMIEGEAHISIRERAQARLGNQEINRQENLENIVEKSLNYLPESVSEIPVDKDWRTRYFNKAQDISSEKMQEIWAKILADEVSNPGKTSIRTLETLSNISKKEAEIFGKACTLSSENSRILKFNENFLHEYNINYGDLMILRDAGLIHESDNLNFQYSKSPKLNGTIVAIGNSQYIITKKEGEFEEMLKLNQISFTIAGKELCSSLGKVINQEYIKKYILFLENKGYKLEKLIPGNS